MERDDRARARCDLGSADERRGCRTLPVITGCSAIEESITALNMAISPDGKSLYAGPRGTIAGVASYDRDPATGALTKRPGASTSPARRLHAVRSIGNLYSMHVAPDGENLYVLAQRVITTFDRDPVPATSRRARARRRASRPTARPARSREG